MKSAKALRDRAYVMIEEGKTLKEIAKIIGKKEILAVYLENYSTPPGRSTGEVLLNHIITLVDGINRALSMKP